VRFGRLAELAHQGLQSPRLCHPSLAVGALDAHDGEGAAVGEIEHDPGVVRRQADLDDLRPGDTAPPDHVAHGQALTIGSGMDSPESPEQPDDEPREQHERDAGAGVEQQALVAEQTDHQASPDGHGARHGHGDPRPQRAKGPEPVGAAA
jgi:hypothetical protein